LLGSVAGLFSQPYNLRRRTNPILFGERSMLRTLDRRDFLRTSAGISLAATLPLRADDKAGKPLFLISLAQWSLHRAFFGKKLDPLDFPVLAKRDYGIDAVEYVNQFYMGKAKDKEYIAQLKKRAEDNGVKSVLIMCDNEGALGDPDEKKRQQAAENHYKWVELAKYLGCHSIRVNAYSKGSPEEQMDRVADGLRKLTEFGAMHEINVIVENHGGLSSNGEWLTGVMRKVNHPRCGTLPDFGNFDKFDRYKGVELMMPFAKGVSAKSHDFDAQGNETHTDYRRMMKIVLAAGYHGRVGIEYEGSKLSEPEGIRATKRLLERIRTEMSS
jgi:L-ribulose-5-phosphate 3-epimerase